MPGTHYASIQNPRQYRALRRQGYDKESAARISNAQTPGSHVKEFDESKVSRDETGKFGSGSGGGAAKKPPKKRTPKPPAPTAEEASANSYATLGKLSINENSAEALRMLNADDGDMPGADAINSAGFIEAGLVKQEADGSFSITSAGKKLIKASESGDAEAAGKVIEQSRAKQDRKRSIAAARQQQRDAKKKPAKAAGGGGGAAKPKPAAAAPTPKPTRQETASATAAKVGLAPNETNALGVAADGGKVAEADIDHLADLGLIGVNSNHEFEITPQGRQALGALERGDTRGYHAAVQSAGAAQSRAAKKPATKAMRPGRARIYRQAYASAKDAGLAPDLCRRAACMALRQHTANGKQRQAERARLAIYKDATGADRWVSVSSSAYRDRDGEIVSTAALIGAVAKADASGLRGPLRFWHVPGLDIGDCDFQATTHHGRFLLESGTFRSPQIAAKIKAAGPLQTSIGFLHPADQPAGGVFTDISIFERSVVPAGRAANPMTSLTTKERRMDDRKRAAFVELLGQDLLDQLLTTTAATDKAAQDAGATYKAEDAPPAWATAILDRLDALEGTTKAPLPPDAAAAAVMAADAPVLDDAAEAADLAEDAAEETESRDVVDMTEDDLRAVIADVIAQQLGAMSGTLTEMDQKMAAMGYQRAEKKEAADSALATELASVKAQLVELQGLQPRAARLGHTVPVETAKAIQTQADPTQADPIASFLSGFNLNGAGH